MEVDLGLGHIVLDGDPAPPPERGTAAPLLSAHVYCGQTVAHLSYCCALVTTYHNVSCTQFYLHTFTLPFLCELVRVIMVALWNSS